MAFNVFVSYSTRDLAVVVDLQELLGRAGAKTFVAEYSVPPGTSLPASILQAIKESDLFLLLWSTHAKTSEWVPQEIGVAKGAGKEIMPLVLHDGLTLPGFLQELKYLPLFKEPTAATRWLEAFVRQRVISQKNIESAALFAISAAILFALAKSE